MSTVMAMKLQIKINRLLWHRQQFFIAKTRKKKKKKQKFLHMQCSTLIFRNQIKVEKESSRDHSPKALSSAGFSNPSSILKR